MLISVLVIGFLLVVVVAFPPIDWDLNQRRNQKSAFLRVRDLRRALELHRERCGGFPGTLEALAAQTSGQPNCSHSATLAQAMQEENERQQDPVKFDPQYAGYVMEAILQGNQGYRFIYEPFSPQPIQGLFGNYRIHADPLVPGKTGFRFYYIDDHTSVRWSEGRPAGPDDPEPQIDPILDMDNARFWRSPWKYW